MNLKCPKCLGEGVVEDTDILADNDDTIECDRCEGSGAISSNEITDF